MPTIEAQLQTLLGNLCSGRCYPLIAPEGTVSPFITFQKVSGIPDMDLDGPGRENCRFQFDVWGTTYSAAKTLAESAKTAMVGASFSNTPIMAMDLYEEVSKEYRVMLEYYIWP